MMDFKKRWPDFFIPAGLIACLMVIFMPLPAGMMDLLLAANITVAVIVLLTAVYVRTPMELSLFPSLLLATTMARLALNIGTTRLILTRGPIDHEQAAGGVIASFANFVTGGSLIIGLVIFSIIVVVQFVVITKGASRISEVTARFTLDGLPGRQLAIDADLNAGLIDHQQASDQRKQLLAQSDFYGAMDGASQFVRGDAVAGVIITLINITGGLVLGMSQGMSIGDATETFTRLTIGDGLVSQLPALLISLAAGVLVTRSNSAMDLSRKTIEQIFARPIVLMVAAAFLVLLVITELPVLPLLAIAAGCVATAWALRSSPDQQPAPAAPTRPVEMPIDKLLANDLLEIELGVELLTLADTRQGGNLLESISAVRQRVASDMGIIVPKIRVRDNLKLGRREYRLMVQGMAADRGIIEPDQLLAIDTGMAREPLDGRLINSLASPGIAEPAFWIDHESADAAQSCGYSVQLPGDVLSNQLHSIVLEHADQLLTRDATAQLLDELKKSSPKLVDDVVPEMVTLGELQLMLRDLAAAGVSIRPLHLILETLASIAGSTSNRFERIEKIRVRLGRHITAGLAGDANLPIAAFTVADELQNRIACAWDRDQDEIRLDMPPSVIEKLALAIEEASLRMSASGLRPIALVQQSIRPVIEGLRTGEAAGTFILGDVEAAGAIIEKVGEITSEQLSRFERQAA